MSEHVTFCRICEPYCGLLATVDGGKVTKLRPDPDHVLSAGYACKVGLASHEIAHDPDRILYPQKRVGGQWHRIGWDQALGEIGSKLLSIRERYGPHAIGLYLGNPAGFAYPHRIFASSFADAVGTRNVFGAGSTDNLSVFVAANFLFGSPVRLPIPDLSRTDHLLMLGVNPMVSHGTIINLHRPTTALKALKRRGARIVVVDPRVTETARIATSHHFIVPDTDAWLLLAMIHTILAEGLVDHSLLDQWTHGVAELRQRLAPFTPEVAASHTRIDAETIRNLARDFALAPSACCYARLTCGRFGTLCSWAVYTLNIITGNLDRPGGLIFGEAAVDLAKLAKLSGVASYGTYRSRIGDHPDVLRELPTGIIADEITTPGDGQIRALIVDAGNPVLSAANGDALSAALEELELLVAIDIYRNETTDRAHYFLPATTFLERADFPLLHISLQETPYLQWTDAVIEPVGEARQEWRVFADLSDIMGIDVLNSRLVSLFRKTFGKRAINPELVLDMLLRLGPLGDHYLPWSDGINLDKVKARAHGMKVSAKRTGVMADRLETADGKIRLWPTQLDSELVRLRELPAPDPSYPLQLIGRRDTRSHNSWVHNAPSLMKKRCRRLRMNPTDASARGLSDGELVRVSSRVGSVDAELLVTEELMEGVVSMPHGWSQGDGTGRRHVAATKGPNPNQLIDQREIEPLAGMAFLNGFPVQVGPKKPG